MSVMEVPLMIYGARELAHSFRTVRQNTIQIAEDIPEDRYSFRATPEVRTVAEELAHIAVAPSWQQQAHGLEKKTFISLEEFGAYMGRAGALEKELTTKAQIVDALKTNGETFARFLEGLREEQLAETVSFPPPVQPSQKTRFEMLLGVKEHEMHHRAKLMLVQRLIGIVPHLTQRRQQMQAGATAGTPAAATAGVARA
jgi:uncharacterized damage-inducible protein DinB